jgi:hypothetical protein
MQVKATREQKFEPVVLELTFTSEQEIQAFFSICNVTAIVEAAVGIDLRGIRSTLKEIHPNAYSENSYASFFERLKDNITK